MNPLQHHPNFKIDQNDYEELNPSFKLRYPHIPKSYLIFLTTFSLATNSSDTTWFNSISDFNETNEESDFKWNEFELQSKEVFQDDKENQELIQKFWDAHLPIILSVKNKYAFFAIGVSKENFGKIYYGEDPEYEEVELVSNDFTSFMDNLMNKKLETNYIDLFY